jgi:hypothetical protein
MANMGHCRFNNTLNDLRDCYDHLGDENLSNAEFMAMLDLVQMCAKVVNSTVGIGDPEFKVELKTWLQEERESRSQAVHQS